MALKPTCRSLKYLRKMAVNILDFPKHQAPGMECDAPLNVISFLGKEGDAICSYKMPCMRVIWLHSRCPVFFVR